VTSVSSGSVSEIVVLRSLGHLVRVKAKDVG
jgi:hypothetical protein